MKKLTINHWLITAALFCIAGMVMAISPSEKYQLDTFKTSTLKGLSGVAVSVKIVRDDEKTLPLLKENELQGEVEIALQSAGVEVSRPAPNVGMYVVLVKVFAAGKDNMSCAFHIQSLMLQTVALERDPSIKTDAQTWPLASHARFGTVSLAITKSMITRTVKDQAKEFAEDYKAANPKTAEDTGLKQKATDLIWGEEVNGLRAAVEFVPEKNSYSIGEKIGTRLLVKNVSGKPLNKGNTIGQGFQGQSDIVDEQGKNEPFDKIMWAQEWRGSSLQMIESGETLVYNGPQIDISGYDKNRTPGQYVVTFKLDFNRKLMLETGKRNLTIEPNNLQ